MAFIVADRVQETATANTTVSFTLTGAITSYQSFSAIGDTNTTYYGATDGTNWEVGLGTYSTTGPTLTRTTILSSSNSGSAVTFSGTVTVWCDYPAGKQISSDYPNNLGVVTPAAGTFTTLTSTGGAVNGTIGATTPAAGTFTTITGQTARVNGTGQNLFTYSQAAFNTNWLKFGTPTVSDSSTTAPDSTSTASTLTCTTTSDYIYQSQTIVVGSTYTWSIYVKNSTATTSLLWVRNTSQNAQIYLNWSGTTLSSLTQTLGTATFTAVGNSWYRVSITFTAVEATPRFRIFAGDNLSATGVIFIWGTQAEVGSTANTYIPTTTTAIYGTPTLSFSGVAGLGLQSDGSLYVQPAGTGAIQAQPTTGVASTGGNARGTYAADFQMQRASAARVASATNSFIGAGYDNATSGGYSVIVGGYSNSVTKTSSSVVGGQSNQTLGSYAVVCGGLSNTLNGTYSAIVGGNTNTAAGYYNFIGTGFTNSGTSSSAVTTQSGTMNGTTAVTLSGSNASIKVGQYIIGTSIADNTYVAAISGTSLTLSQAASGSSTSTLSFYTPHGVVVGGGNNQATGSYSFIGGGGDAGTAANRNVASGDWSVVCGGAKNLASGLGSVVVGGGFYGTGFQANTATASYSSIVGGVNNQAISTGSFIGGGDTNYANGYTSSITGGSYGTARGIAGYTVFPACYAPVASSLGVSQAALLVLGAATTDATATVLKSNSSAAGGSNQVILPNNSAYYFKGSVIANVTGAASGAAWSFEGAIMRGANAASTVLIGTPVLDRVAVSSGASLWVVALTADTTNGGLAVTVTGVASTTIRWVAKLETTEVTY
jgi:hypothetical protein